MLLAFVANTLARGFSAKIESFCRLPINFGRSSSTCTFPVRINGVNPTELEAKRRYGESSLTAALDAAAEVEGCGETSITSIDMREEVLETLLRLDSVSLKRCRN